MLNETQLHELLLQYKAGTLDQKGRELLEGWAAQAPQNRELLDLLTAGSRLVGEMTTLYSYDEKRVWKNISAKAAVRRRRSVFRIALRASAAAAVIAVVAFGADSVYERSRPAQGIVSVVEPGRTMALLELSSGEQIRLTDKAAGAVTEADRTQINIDSAATRFTVPEKQKQAEQLFNTITVPKGCEYNIELSDGTKVWLNAGSQLVFPTQFARDARRVELSGEAYFEVKSDPSSPFIVKTERLSVEALGTSFNVMSYSDELLVEATLLSGSVRVRQDAREMLLKPGMQVRYDRSDNSMTVQEVYAESYAAWARHMFVFFNEPIESICRKLSRWYDVEIDASSKRLKGIYYSGMIRRTETLNSIAELLSSTDELLFREVDGKMVVDRK